jgi:hypothetical protein
MDRRQSPRVATLLPVRVWGIDAHSLPFMQPATVTNISASGAVVQGIQRTLRPGDILEVQFAGEKAEFRVVWVGRIGTSQQWTVGLERVASQPCIWQINLRACNQSAASA